MSFLDPGVVVQPLVWEEALEIYKMFLVHAAELNIFVPKCHLLAHILLRSRYFGNPLTYAVWEDESKNKLLKAVLQLCSQATFERSAFAKIEPMLLSDSKRRKLA